MKKTILEALQAINESDKKSILQEVVAFLIDDEEEAISGYDDAISKLNDNQKAVDLFNHIKEEEIEHIKELKELLNS